MHNNTLVCVVYKSQKKRRYNARAIDAYAYTHRWEGLFSFSVRCLAVIDATSGGRHKPPPQNVLGANAVSAITGKINLRATTHPDSSRITRRDVLWFYCFVRYTCAGDEHDGTVNTVSHVRKWQTLEISFGRGVRIMGVPIG